MTKIGNKITNVIWTIAIVLFVLSIGAFYWFVQYRPPVPQPQFGYTKPINNHGSIHYVTTEEDFLLDTLDASAAISILLAIVLSWKFKKQNQE
jgi:hypothetical protein